LTPIAPFSVFDAPRRERAQTALFELLESAPSRRRAAKKPDKPSVNRAEEEAVSMENKTLVQRWFVEVWNKGRAAVISEMLAYFFFFYGLVGDLHGAAEFQRFHSAYRNAYPDVAIEIEDLVAEGDIVAVRWSATGTHRGDGLGFAATGRHVEFSGMTFVRVADGKLAEGWNNFDQLGMFQQLGVVNLPPLG
jgi:steroid delta-isomerase-like uncharacterized protein